jgi:PAS domain-containing protein
LHSAAPGTPEPVHVLTELDAGFRILFMNNPQPMWVYNLKTLQLLEVNDAAVRHYGYSRNEFLQLLISDIRPACAFSIFVHVDFARVSVRANPLHP